MATQDIVWEPTKDYIEQANITRFMKKHRIRRYEELLAHAEDKIEWFWDAVMKDLDIEWYEPYTQVLDDSEGIQWVKWFVDGKINIVHNVLDRHVHGTGPAACPDKLAVIWEGEDGTVRKLTYRDLDKEVCKLANGLKTLGVNGGDTVGLYLPMTTEVVIAVLACLKLGAICIPIFSGFGPVAVATRLQHGESKVLITADGSYRRGRPIDIKTQADIAVAEVPSIEHVVVLRRLGADSEATMTGGRDVWWHELVAEQSEACETSRLHAEAYSFLIYTSGTTGKPKGSVHTHAGCMAQMCKELAYYFDVKHDDNFFWLTDIGWMMGPWMIIGVLHPGGTILIFEGAPDYPDPGRLWALIERYNITHLGISPTAIRLLMRYGEQWVTKYDLSSLRILGSTGEPWDTESWLWFFEKVGKRRLPIINISGGTEIVGCFLSPMPITALKPCTLRGPGLGMGTDVFDDSGKPIRGEKGHLVAKVPAPSMTKGFWRDRQRYFETYWSRWANVWYHGDWASVDEDGFWFLHGRSDDTLKVAGHRIGPAELESCLIEHPAVSEAAVVGVPHEIRGEGIVTFLVLQPGREPNDALRTEIKEHVAKILSKTLRPDEVLFVDALPKTRSGKIVRRIIRAKYLGEDLGDLSSIENPDALEGIAPGK